MRNSVIVLLCVHCFNCDCIFNELGKLLSVHRIFCRKHVCCKHGLSVVMFSVQRLDLIFFIIFYVN